MMIDIFKSLKVLYKIRRSFLLHVHAVAKRQQVINLHAV